MAADDARRSPPRRPGEATAQNLRITINVRWGLALLGLALLLAALLATGVLPGEAAEAAVRATTVTFLLGSSALGYAALSALRGRRR